MLEYLMACIPTLFNPKNWRKTGASGRPLKAVLQAAFLPNHLEQRIKWNTKSNMYHNMYIYIYYDILSIMYHCVSYNNNIHIIILVLYTLNIEIQYMTI